MSDSDSQLISRRSRRKPLPPIYRRAAFVASLRGVRHVDLLPYHATGAPKFARTGREDPLGDISPPSGERMAACARPFLDAGLEVHIGGDGHERADRTTEA